MGIEPTSEAWEASILPLNYARSVRKRTDYTELSDVPHRPAIKWCCRRQHPSNGVNNPVCWRRTRKHL